MKKWLAVLLSIFLLTGCELSDDFKNSIQVNNVDLANVSNGTFEGDYKHEDSGGNAKVSVIVENHEIIDVKLLEFNEWL